VGRAQSVSGEDKRKRWDETLRRVRERATYRRTARCERWLGDAVVGWRARLRRCDRDTAAAAAAVTRHGAAVMHDIVSGLWFACGC